jgi:hypothetical protein
VYVGIGLEVHLVLSGFCMCRIVVGSLESIREDTLYTGIGPDTHLFIDFGFNPVVEVGCDLELIFEVTLFSCTGFEADRILVLVGNGGVVVNFVSTLEEMFV